MMTSLTETASFNCKTYLIPTAVFNYEHDFIASSGFFENSGSLHLENMKRLCCICCKSSKWCKEQLLPLPCKFFCLNHLKGFLVCCSVLKGWIFFYHILQRIHKRTLYSSQLMSSDRSRLPSKLQSNLNPLEYLLTALLLPGTG